MPVVGLVTGSSSPGISIVALESRSHENSSPMPFFYPWVTPNVSKAVGKIYVSQSGAIFLNGKSVTSGSLKAELKKLKEANGVVWYSRENGAADPSDQQMFAIKIVVDEELPIQLYTDKTFTTMVTVQP